MFLFINLDIWCIYKSIFNIFLFLKIEMINFEKTSLEILCTSLFIINLYNNLFKYYPFNKIPTSSNLCFYSIPFIIFTKFCS